MIKQTYYIFFIFLFFTNLLAQEQLYLIDTLVGKSYTKEVRNAKSLGDVNGDGFADFIVGNDDSTRIYLGNSGFELKANFVFAGWKGFFPLGDINNDGYDDFILGDSLYYGTAKFDMTNVIPFDLPIYYYRQSISENVGEIGDVNGDGYNDFVISSPYNFDNGFSFVWLYLGGDTVKTEPFVTFYNSPWVEGNSEGSFGLAVTGIGDINNDGYDDILISDPLYNSNVPKPNFYGRISLYYGGKQMDAIVDSFLTGFGTYLLNIGDINGDSTNEFILENYKGYSIYTIKKGKIDSLAHITARHSCFSCRPIESGDINGDGFIDIVVANQEKTLNGEWIGSVSCYLGSAEFDTIADYYILSEKRNTYFSYYLDFIGDFNGDGYDDFVVITPKYPDDENKKGKLYLYSYKNYTSIRNIKKLKISNFSLQQNYPNPFNPTTIIKYQIPSFSKQTNVSSDYSLSNVELKIYDILGKEVTTLLNKPQNPGNYQIKFNAKNLPSGVYYYQLKAGEYSETKKMILIR